MMLIIDTATDRGIAAVGDPGTGEIVRETQFPADKQASAEIFSALEKFRDDLADVTWVVVGLGPGSYSGIRVAICAALGIAMPRNLKLGGVCSLAAIDTGSGDSDFCVIGDARRQSFFLAQFTPAGESRGEIRLLSEDELREALTRDPQLPRFAWDPRAAELFDAPRARPTAQRLFALAGRAEAPLQPQTVLEPLYLRDPHITTPTRNRPLFG